MKKQEKTSVAGGAGVLIALCWLVYTCSYIGKLGYNANISQIGPAYGVSYADAGMVSTFFFFAYGGGQVINGLLCRRYPIQPVVFTCLTVSGIINILVAVGSDFSVLKYLWLINGVAMSFLWTILIRLLSETVSKKEITRANYVMGTTVATGTFLVYGMSALFAAVLSWRVTFWVAAGILFASALVWLLSYRRLVEPLKRARAMETDVAQKATPSASKTVGGWSAILGVLPVLAVFSVSNNFVKDGLTAWTPDILSELYQTPGWLSILLTLLLPAMAIGGVTVATRLFGRTKSFVGVCALLFGGSSLLVGAVILLIKTELLPLTVGCLALVACLMSGVNNVVTGMIPLHMKEKVNSGALAGVLNGFCYLGSTVSMYGLGAVADAWGWQSVFSVLLGVNCFAVLVGGVYLLCKRLRSEKTI